MPKRVGVILSGCGFRDGSEIHESVLALLALDRAGAQVICMAPNKKQTSVVDHLAGKTTPEERNVLVESARIARGKIKDVNQVKASDLDAVLLPGGYGAASNLSTFSKQAETCTVDEGVARLLREIRAANKPIAALCIAPAVLARVFGSELHPELTIGDDGGTAAALVAMGARHTKAKVSDVVIDRKNKIVTTPCYMYDARISEVAAGADKAVKALLELI